MKDIKNALYLPAMLRANPYQAGGLIAHSKPRSSKGTVMCCAVCGCKDKTLQSFDGRYYCKECLKKLGVRGHG